MSFDPPTPAVRRRMSAQRRRDTAAEVRIRQGLFGAGFRYRCGVPVPGRPRRSIDIAFTRWRVAVFVDGCFWHGCPDHFVPPKSNAIWWRAKINANRERDMETSEILSAAGWTVVRLWEHVSTDQAVQIVRDELVRAKASLSRRRV